MSNVEIKNDLLQGSKYSDLTNVILSLISEIRQKNAEMKYFISQVDELLSSLNQGEMQEDYNFLVEFRKLLKKQIYNYKDDSLYGICNLALSEIENITGCNLFGKTFEEVVNIVKSNNHYVDESVYNDKMLKIKEWKTCIDDIKTNDYHCILNYYKGKSECQNYLQELDQISKEFVYKMDGVKDDKITKKYNDILFSVDKIKAQYGLLPPIKMDDYSNVHDKIMQVETYKKSIHNFMSAIKSHMKYCINMQLSFQKSIDSIANRVEKTFSEYKELEEKMQKLLAISSCFSQLESKAIHSLIDRFNIESREIYELYNNARELNSLSDNAKVVLFEVRYSVLYRKYGPQIKYFFNKYKDILEKNKNFNEIIQMEEISHKTRILLLIEKYMKSSENNNEISSNKGRKRKDSEIRLHLNNLYTTINNMSEDSFDEEDVLKCEYIVVDLTKKHFYTNSYKKFIIDVIEEWKQSLIDQKRNGK